MNSQVFVKSLANRDRLMSQRRVYWREKSEKTRLCSCDSLSSWNYIQRDKSTFLGKLGPITVLSEINIPNGEPTLKTGSQRSKQNSSAYAHSRPKAQGLSCKTGEDQGDRRERALRSKS